MDRDALLVDFGALHRQVYDVYDLPLDRDQVHDLLASSFAGRALTSEYVEHWTTKILMQRDETAIDILRVDHDELVVLDAEDDVAHIDAAWSVGGIVTHRKHKHPRVNRYQAVYSLQRLPQGWRIVGTRMRNLQRVRSASQGGDAFTFEQVQDDRGGYLDPLDLLDAGVGEDTGEPDTDGATP